MNESQYSEQVWQTLHEEIQKRFRVLAADVQAVAPSAKPRYGKTVTKRFPLFSHVSFSLVQDGAGNEIIVGVDIGPEDGHGASTPTFRTRKKARFTSSCRGRRSRLRLSRN
jgi:hypothetical protein